MFSIYFYKRNHWFGLIVSNLYSTMRRSLAPSKQYKRASDENRDPNKRSCYKKHYDFDVDSDREDSEDKPVMSASTHELLIIQILKKPFKIPIEGYEGGSNSSRSLGMRRAGLRVALHDPYADGALVLFYPPEQTAHDQMTSPEASKAQVSSRPLPTQFHGESLYRIYRYTQLIIRLNFMLYIVKDV